MSPVCATVSMWPVASPDSPAPAGILITPRPPASTELSIEGTHFFNRIGYLRRRSRRLHRTRPILRMDSLASVNRDHAHVFSIVFCDLAGKRRVHTAIPAA